MKSFQLPSPLCQLKAKDLQQKGIEIWLKRDDLIHPVVSGNKLRKLLFNIQEAKNLNHNTLLTFGGAYSNHLVASAEAAKLFGLKSIGIVRGDEGFQNDSLKAAQKSGMHLHFVSRAEYQQKETEEYHEQLKHLFGRFFLIPEGGSNDLGIKGCEAIYQELKKQFDYIAVALGTGTTAAGILNVLNQEKLLLFPALKGWSTESFPRQELMYQKNKNVEAIIDYHFGGFAKVNQELIDFYYEFQEREGIELDLIYTAKMMYGIYDLAKKDYFKKGSKIIAIHTGGLQGNKSLLAG